MVPFTRRVGYVALDLVEREKDLGHLADVITQSFGATENTFPSKSSILGLRSAFFNAAKRHVTVLASSGDDGSTDAKSDFSCCYEMPVNSWPSADPLITSIGGTQLHLDAKGNRISPDVTWNDGYGATGGGVSHIFARPAFQDSVRDIVGSHRGTPDISMSAAVDGGAVFYYSFCDYSRADPTTGQPPLCGPQWHIVGGTSEAHPCSPVSSPSPIRPPAIGWATSTPRCTAWASTAMPPAAATVNTPVFVGALSGH